jgi:hypothetical protein
VHAFVNELERPVRTLAADKIEYSATPQTPDTARTRIEQDSTLRREGP